MQFQIPKFLERETTIALGLKFKSLAIMGGLGLGLFFLYYVLPKFVFFPLAILLGIIFVVFQFVKIKNQTLFEVVMNSVKFFLSPRIYSWQKRKGLAMRRIIKEEKQEEKREKQTPLKFAAEGKLGKLRSKIDIGER